MSGFKLIDTSRDGRIIRQTYARELGTAGCLVLVSTTLYTNREVPVDPSHPVNQLMSTEEMITSVPIESLTESLAYVPGIKLGEEGMEPIEGFGGAPEAAPNPGDPGDAGLR